MKNKTLLVAAGCAAFSASVFAQQAEPASAPAEEGHSITITVPKIPLPEVPKDVKLEVSAFMQVQYAYAAANGYGAGKTESGFSLRRTNIAAKANVGKQWKAVVSYEIDSGTGGGWNYNDYLDKAIVQYLCDAGTLTLGQQKNRFMVEEYTSALKLPAIERSVNSNYIAGNSGIKGLASYHIGAFWDGKLNDDLSYGISLTNATSRDYNKESNDFCVTGNFGYNLKLDDEVSLFFGLNGIVNFSDDGVYGNNTVLANAGTVWGIEPYIRYTDGGLSVLIDSYYIGGDDDSRIHRTLAAGATVAYRIDDNWEPVVRATYLNAHTEAYGIKTSLQNHNPTSGGLPNATSYYLGANYYVNKYVKISAGYEYIHTFGHGTHADSNCFRTQCQIAF